MNGPPLQVGSSGGSGVLLKNLMTGVKYLRRECR